MERDFLGLRAVKEENTDIFADSALTRGGGMQWSFSNKRSAHSQYLSFKASHEDRPCSGFMTISTLDSLDANQKSQKKICLDKKVNVHYPTASYPLQQFGAHSIVPSHEMRMSPASNQPSQTITGSMKNPMLHSNVSPLAQNIVCSTLNSQPLGGVPVMPPVSVLPATSSLVGSADIRAANKHIGSPAQLTIFYAGSVNVFDDVSPEKAQAIMLLAGNGSSVTHHKIVSAAEVQAQFRKPTADDRFNGCKSHPPHILGLQGNVSVNSQAVSPSGGKAHGNVELATVRSVGAFEPPIIQAEPSNVICSSGASSSTMFPAVALPQFRKASLARFLEKRKERMLSSSPYPVSKILPDGSKKGTEDLNISPQTASS